jgi:hypothetical protein
MSGQDKAISHHFHERKGNRALGFGSMEPKAKGSNLISEISSFLLILRILSKVIGQNRFF